MNKKILSILLLPALALFVACDKGTSGEQKLSVENAWVIEVPETQKMSAAFMTINNGTDADDNLISASSDIAAVNELHEMVHEGDTMKMRKIEKIAIPAGQTVELKRGGLHVMLINLQKRPVDGDTVKLELEFEKAGKIALDVPVKKAEMDESMKH